MIDPPKNSLDRGMGVKNVTRLKLSDLLACLVLPVLLHDLKTGRNTQILLEEVITRLIQITFA